MSSKPSLVFVPGAWHKATVWSKVIQILEKDGYTCIPVTLPSTTSDPSISFIDDLLAVRKAITSQTALSHNVVLIAHSYGGAVGASALKDLTSPTTDGNGHVLGFALMASGFGAPGKSFLEGIGGSPPPSWKLNYETGYAELIMDPRDLFYHDLSEEEGKFWVGELQNQSLRALTEGGEEMYPGWKDTKTWYLVTAEDRAYLHPEPKALQMGMVEWARGEGVDVKVREVGSSHSPMLSCPEETAGFILEAVGDFVAGL